MRVDLFGVREGGSIDGELHRAAAPERARALRRGKSYLVEAVVRTVKIGHPFTQGTVDSNEVWLDLTVKSGDRVDRPQRRPGRERARSIRGRTSSTSTCSTATATASTAATRRTSSCRSTTTRSRRARPTCVHYLLEVPADAGEPITVEAKLHYRKFDTTYMQHVYGPDFKNDLPVLDARHRHA